MISGWELYVVLKLDSFHAFFQIIGGIGLIPSIGGLIIATIASFDNDEMCKVLANKAVPLFRKTSIVSGLFLAASLFLPTTKQAAAVLIIPKIATNENMEEFSDEAKNLYSLAKEYFLENIKHQQQTNK